MTNRPSPASGTVDPTREAFEAFKALPRARPIGAGPRCSFSDFPELVEGRFFLSHRSKEEEAFDKLMQVGFAGTLGASALNP